MKQILLILFIALFLHELDAQTIVINEFMATNTTFMTDEFGEYEDWVEIYNYGTSPVDIAGLYISDDFFSPLNYQLPYGNDSTIIAPGEYLVLWADNDPEQGVLHLDIKLSGGGEQLALFTNSGNIIDSITFNAQIPNVSFGRFPDNANNWVFFAQASPGESNALNYLTASVYGYTFSSSANQSIDIQIYSNENWSLTNPVSWLTINPAAGSGDGSLVVSVSSANTSGSERIAVLTLSGTSVADQEIIITQFASEVLPTIVINELMAENDNLIYDEMGEYDDWIELYNYGGSSVDIGGMYITDDLNDPLKYQFPDDSPSETTIDPGDFLLIWADDDSEQGTLHANFKLSNNGEEVGLFLNQYTGIDSVIFPVQYADTSYGRAWDAANAWTYFVAPTPLASNANSIEEASDAQFNVYPNPFSERIYFQCDFDYSRIDLCSLQGKRLLSLNSSDQHESILLNSLEAGIYIIRVISDQGIYHQRIVKN